MSDEEMLDSVEAGTEETKEEATQDQIKARIAGAVALVAAEFHVSVQQVTNAISVEEGYKFAVENNVDLFAALKTGYARCMAIAHLIQELAVIVKVDFDPLFQFTDWYKVYDDALAKKVDPLTAMKEYFTANAKRPQTEPKAKIDPQRAFRNDLEEQRKKQFKPGTTNQERRDAQKRKQDKAREDAVRKKREQKVDSAADDQLGSDFDDGGSFGEDEW